VKKFRYEYYEEFRKRKSEILEKISKIPEQIGMPKKYKGKIGLSGGSGTPPLIMEEVIKEMVKSSRTLMKVADLDTKIRNLVKLHYGDDYDGVVINTCEAALWVTFDTLISPPFSGRGDSYISRYIAPYERHIHHQAGYGRPFPPKYKDITADRGATAGELGLIGKRLYNTVINLIPLAGANYSCHGIKYYPLCLLLNVDPHESARVFDKLMQNNKSQYLSGITSIGYDSPGYGYGLKEKDGTPILLRKYGSIAKEYNIPYICDNARGTPFLGTDLRKIGADVMVYSTDKAFGAPTGGLIIGKEDVMVQIRRAMGIHSSRSGAPSHAKAGFVAFDPGKEVLAGLVKTLEFLLEKPKYFTEPVDQMYKIIKEEFNNINEEILKCLVVSKSYNGLNIEINYENTWENSETRIPFFSIEDMYAGTNLIQEGCKIMGINPTLGYDANISINPNIGTVNEKGQLLEEPTRYMVKCMVKMLETLNQYSKKIEGFVS